MAATTDYSSRSQQQASTRRPGIVPSTSTSSGTAPAAAGAAPTSPRSPRTPLLGRSISSQFGSPGSFTREQEDLVVYELGARHFSAGFAGESRPRCQYKFRPEQGRRVGDYSAWELGTENEVRREPPVKDGEDGAWAEGYELYSSDLRKCDLGLVEDKLTRALRQIHHDHLQLDATKPRKVILALPTLLPTPLINVALKVLFEHYAQPPSVQLVTIPIMACVSAGQRNALVVDLGWEESVVSAIGEYKIVAEGRTVRAGKKMILEMARLIGESAGQVVNRDLDCSLREAEEVVERMAWVRVRASEDDETDASRTLPRQGKIRLPVPGDSDAGSSFSVPFHHLSDAAETVLFPSSPKMDNRGRPVDEPFDDHDLPIPRLAFKLLLALPIDLRSLCTSRMIVTGGLSHLPGLKRRLLQELQHLISTCGWDRVGSYGSATSNHRERIAKERSAQIQRLRKNKPPDSTSKEVTPPSTSHSQIDGASPTTTISSGNADLAQRVPPSARSHDDENDFISVKAERASRAAARKAAEAKAQTRQNSNEDGETVIVSGVESLGAWAGASLIASLRVKGAHEVEREEFWKSGWREGGDGRYI